MDATSTQVKLSKPEKIRQRELDLAKRWNRDGLLSAAGLAAVEAAAK